MKQAGDGHDERIPRIDVSSEKFIEHVREIFGEYIDPYARIKFSEEGSVLIAQDPADAEAEGAEEEYKLNAKATNHLLDYIESAYGAERLEAAELLIEMVQDYNYDFDVATFVIFLDQNIETHFLGEGVQHASERLLRIADEIRGLEHRVEHMECPVIYPGKLDALAAHELRHAPSVAATLGVPADKEVLYTIRFGGGKKLDVTRYNLEDGAEVIEAQHKLDKHRNR